MSTCPTVRPPTNIATERAISARNGPLIFARDAMRVCLLLQYCNKVTSTYYKAVREGGGRTCATRDYEPRPV